MLPPFFLSGSPSATPLADLPLRKSSKVLRNEYSPFLVLGSKSESSFFASAFDGYLVLTSKGILASRIPTSGINSDCFSASNSASISA